MPERESPRPQLGRMETTVKNPKKHSTPAKPKERDKYESFILDFSGGSEGIPWDRIPNRGLFAVEENASAWMRRRLFIARTLEELRQTLQLYASKGMLPDPANVFVLTAACEEDLPDLVSEEILHTVLFGIERLKERGNKDALREVRRALERKGTKRGAKSNAENNRWLIELLARVVAEPEKSFKEIVPKPWTRASASARLSKFCWDFYMDCVLFRAENSERWAEPRVAELLNSRHGFQLLDTRLHAHDLSAAKEAYRRGKKQVPESNWPDARLGPFRQC